MTDWNTPEGRRVAEVVAQDLNTLDGLSDGGFVISANHAARILDGDAREWLEKRKVWVARDRTRKRRTYIAFKDTCDGKVSTEIAQGNTYSAALIAAVLAVLKETEDGED